MRRIVVLLVILAILALVAAFIPQVAKAPAQQSAPATATPAASPR